MAKEAVHNMPVTRGTFQVKGIVSGTKSSKFYNESLTKTNKNFRRINFGVVYDTAKTVYIDLNGMPRDKVYYTKKDEKGKTTTISVNWNDRLKGAPEGARMIGVNCGLTKTVNKDNKVVNDNKMLTDFDACKYIAENLTDESSVFIRGNIDFSNARNENGDVRSFTKYVPTQISLCQDVDFADYSDNNKPVNEFTQTIVYTGIEKEEVDGKATGRFLVSAKIVTYSDIINKEFIILDEKLANTFRKGLKPYQAISVDGRIEVRHIVDEPSEDIWGEANSMRSIQKPSVTEMIIIGAYPSTIDKETYTEKKISEAMARIVNAAKAEQNFGDQPSSEVNTANWGDTNSSSDDEDEETPW